MTYNPAASTIVVGSVIVDMAAITTVSPFFTPNPKGFKISIWDLNMDSTSEAPTLRLADGGGVQTTNYNVQKWDKSNPATYTQTAIINQVSTTWISPNGVSSLGLVYGYWEGRLMDVATNLWSIYGMFRDDATGDRAQVEVFAQIALDSLCVSAQVQSENNSTWTAGKLGWQSWT